MQQKAPSSSGFSHLSSDEVLRQVTQWNRTEAPYPQMCLHELFERQVRLTPQARAVIWEQSSLTYEQLDAQANQLARSLRKHLGEHLEADTETGRKDGYTVGAEPRVALFVRHTCPLAFVGFWGILKAGGTIVLMDTAASTQRLAAIFAETQPQVIVAHMDVMDSMTGLPVHDTHVICLDDEEGPVARERTDAVVSCTTLSNVAYLISTSGTTGTPKVVAVAHRALSNLHAAQQRAFGIEPTDRVLHYSPMSFDASIWELMMAHLAGATLCLGTEEALRPGSSLAHFMREERITVATLTPSVLTLMPPAETLFDLRILISVGEACSAHVVSRWAPGRAFYNALGHAEGSICLTIGRCQPDGSLPSVGKAIQNQRIYVVDAQGHLTGVGEPGELYIAGVGLAVGYTQDALTQERFTAPNREDIPESRWYRTGDIVSWLPDGSLMYRGRVEGEYVKVHGVRIEPKEIEAILLEHGAVLSCAVVERSNVEGASELVAFVVLHQDRDADTTQQELWERLDSRLPKAAHPQSLAVLETMPVTAHGKLDIRMLRAWQSPTTTPPDPTPASAQTPLEQELIEHLGRTLQLEALDIDTKITHLRRDSFSLAHLAAEIHNLTGMRITELFIARNPTIRSIAAEVERLRSHQQDLSA